MKGIIDYNDIIMPHAHSNTDRAEIQKIYEELRPKSNGLRVIVRSTPNISTGLIKES